MIKEGSNAHWARLGFDDKRMFTQLYMGGKVSLQPTEQTAICDELDFFVSALEMHLLVSQVYLSSQVLRKAHVYMQLDEQRLTKQMCSTYVNMLRVLSLLLQRTLINVVRLFMDAYCTVVFIPLKLS